MLWKMYVTVVPIIISVLGTGFQNTTIKIRQIMNPRKDRLCSDYDVVSASCEDTEEILEDLLPLSFQQLLLEILYEYYKYMNNNNNNREGGIYNGCIKTKD